VADSALELLACAALMILVVGLAAKKQDRYALPAVPLLAVVAGVGYGRLPLTLRGARTLLVGWAGLAQLALCASERPYYFTYYSPLLGGAPVARHVLPVGRGEGLEVVARYLQAHADKDARPAVAGPDISALVRTNSMSPAKSEQARYVLTYVSEFQRGERAPPGAMPLLTLRINGITYARLYAQPPATRAG